MPLPTQFPSEAEIERLTLTQKYNNLYENKQYEVLGLHDLIKKQFKNLSQLVYVAHAIPSKVSEFYADFVQGDVRDMKIETTGENKDEQKKIDDAVDYNDLREMVYDIAVEQSSIGFVPLLVRIEDGHIVIDQIPQDQYFPQKDGSVIFASYVQKPDAKDLKRDIWLYAQHYLLRHGKAVIERSLWEVADNGQKGAQVSLAAYDATLLQEEKLDIDVLPVVQIDNSRKKRGQYGRSDYADILPQLSEINERTTHVAIQLLKNLDAKMAVPDESGVINKETGEAKQFEFLAMTKESVVPQYIINANPLIEATYTHVERQARYISWFTSVPMDQLISNAAQPERVESLRIRLYSAVRKSDSKRANIRKGLDWALRIGLMLLGFKTPDKIRIEFGDVLPKEPLVDAQVEDIKVRDGLSSRRSSIKRLEGLEDDEVDQEMQAIQQEETVAGINKNNPPQI